MRQVDFSLYLVTDRTRTGGRPLVPLLSQALQAGLRAIQLRERDLDTTAMLKMAEDVRVVVREAGAKLFINDRIDVAIAVGAEGVHLRSDSMPVREARKLLGPDRLIGMSTHTVDEAVQAERDGADFVVLGPVYATPSKAQYGTPIGLRPLEEATRRCRIPVFAIGGVTVSHVHEIKKVGAFGAAVVSAILASDNVEGTTRALLNATTAAG